MASIHRSNFSTVSPTADEDVFVGVKENSNKDVKRQIVFSPIKIAQSAFILVEI